MENTRTAAKKGNLNIIPITGSDETVLKTARGKATTTKTSTKQAN